jgi:hypothetical protein
MSVIRRKVTLRRRRLWRGRSSPSTIVWSRPKWGRAYLHGRETVCGKAIIATSNCVWHKRTPPIGTAGGANIHQSLPPPSPSWSAAASN